MNEMTQKKIFGVGLLKTGTTSLAVALRTLGYRHTHQNRDYLLQQVIDGKLDEVFKWVDQHESFDDWPWPLIYRELDERYPHSRFILTTRSNESVWLESLKRHAVEIGPTVGREVFFGHGMPHGYDADYLTTYNRHNRQVRNYFLDRPDQFLEVCWESGDGWERLCSFLGVNPPKIPFPKVNTANDHIDK